MNQQLLDELKERDKELQCLYRIDEILGKDYIDRRKVFHHILEVIVDGWQYPGLAMPKIILETQEFSLPGFHVTKWFLSSDIIVDNNVLGEVRVYYKDNKNAENPFLPEEQKLLNTIANLLSNYIFHRRLVKTIDFLKQTNINQDKEVPTLPTGFDEHWKWRMKMAQKLADRMDMYLLNIESVYIIGSTKEATAGPGSDIDLLVYFRGSEEQKRRLIDWIDGWSCALEEINHEKTGYNLKEGIIDLHIITDEDIKNKTSYAVMIDSIHNSAKLLRKKTDSP